MGSVSEPKRFTKVGMLLVYIIVDGNADIAVVLVF